MQGNLIQYSENYICMQNNSIDPAMPTYVHQSHNVIYCHFRLDHKEKSQIRFRHFKIGTVSIIAALRSSDMRVSTKLFMTAIHKYILS